MGVTLHKSQPVATVTGVGFNITLLCRDKQQQYHTQALLLKSEAGARAAISGLLGQQQKQKDLSKQIVRATADREELLIDNKQVCVLC